MRIPNSITALTACLLAMAITACASGPSADEELLECQGSCDTVGSLSIPTRWVPVGGSIRAQTAGAPLQVEPSTGVSIEARSGNRWIATFASPGYFTVKSGSDRMSIRVADDGLGIELVSPAPGAFVEAAEGSSLVVRGRVSDSLGANIDHVTVDSKRIEVSAGEFSFPVTSRFGINTVAILATDPAGNDFDVARSFMAAPAFSKQPSAAFIQLDNQGLDFLAETIEPRLGQLLTSIMQDLAAAPDAIGAADSNGVFVDAIHLPGLAGAPGTLDLDIVAGNAGFLKAVVRTSGTTKVEVNTGDGLFDFNVDITARDLTASMTMDFSRYQEVGPIVNDVQLSFAPGQDSFDIDVRNVPSFIENMFVDDQEIREQISNGIKDAVAPELSTLFSSVGGGFDVDLASLSLEGSLRINYGLTDVRAEDGAVRLDLFTTMPAIAASDAPGIPTR